MDHDPFHFLVGHALRSRGPQLRTKAVIVDVDLVTATATMITGNLEILVIFAMIVPNQR